MNGSAPPFGGTNTNNAHIGSSGGLCSSGGGGPGVATQGASHHFENGGHHYKTPIKDGNSNNNNKEGAVGGLVAATPSSITTAGDTAESTLVSQSPNAALTLHRRRSSSRRLSTINTSTQRQPNSLQRQYQLLRSQIMLLLGTSSIGLILFLFYALPLAAFISLALMISSMGALLPVIQSIVRARYEMEMQQPGGLTRYLPEYLRVLLTETSLHDFMTDDTFVMEHRYLLLYFMPGLQPEQLMGYINQLPERHRDALLQPGLGRLMPSVMENFMRVDDGNNNGEGQQQLMLGNGDDASFASGLTVGDHQHLEEEMENAHHNNGEGDDQVTLLEAVTGLRRTLQHAGVAVNNMGGAAPPDGGDEHVVVEMPVENNNIQQQTSLLRAANNAPVNNNDIQDADDNSSFDFSIDLDAHGLTDLVNQNGGEEVTHPEPQNINTPTNVIVEMPQRQAVDNDDQNQAEIQQQEIDLEGRILSEAANAAARNYASQAADIVGETASDVVVSTSSWFIRAGAFTGFVAGMGGIITAAFANQQGIGLNILSITVGTLGGGLVANTGSSSSSSGSAGGSNSGSSNDAAVIERRSNGYQSAINGMLATSAVGFLSAGVAYLVRNRVRSNIAAKREEKRQQEEAKEGDNDKA